MAILLTFRPVRAKLNGEDIFGKISEITLSLKRKVVEHDAIGLPFSVEIPIPGKFEKPEAKISWKNAPPVAVIKRALSTNNFVKVEFTDKLWNADEMQGLQEEEDLDVTISGWLKGSPDLIAKEDAYEGETEIAVTHVRIQGTKTGKIFETGIGGVLKDEFNITSQGV